MNEEGRETNGRGFISSNVHESPGVCLFVCVCVYVCVWERGFRNFRIDTESPYRFRMFKFSLNSPNCFISIKINKKIKMLYFLLISILKTFET
jgi:hypothetical protein